MTIRITGTMSALIVALLLTVVACSSDSQQPVTPADFYKGKTMDLIVSDNIGGETDLLGRVMASYLARDSGANVLVTNRRGAGGLDGMNYLYSSEGDGLTVGVTSAFKFVANYVLDEPAAVYDIEKFSYIMVFGNEPLYLFVSPDGPYQSIADLQGGNNLKIGAGSPSGPISLGGLTVVEILDLDAKVVTGFEGDSARALAVKRGEIIGYISSLPTVKASLDSGMLKPLFTLATERDPLRPDVPAITELVSLTGSVALGVDPMISTSYSVDGKSWSQDRSIRAGTTGSRKRLAWFQQGHMRNWRIQRFRGDSQAHLSFARLEAQIEALAY